MQALKICISKGYLLILTILFYSSVIQAQIQVTLNANGELSIDTTNQRDTVITQSKGGLFQLITKAGTGAESFNIFPAGLIKHVSIQTFSGDDSIFHLAGVDSTILTSFGDDYLYSSGGKSIVEMDYGNDIAYFLTGENWVQTSSGADLLWGGSGEDHFWGEDDNDLLLGGGDDDVLIAGPGDDFLAGGSGNDYMEGDGQYLVHGSDILLGGPGKDQLDGFMKNDILCGGDDNDLLLGGAGDDLMFGETGADHHDGYAGNDDMYGNPNLGDTFINGNMLISDLLCSEIIEMTQDSMQMVANSEQLLAVSDGQSYVHIAGTDQDDTILIQSSSGEVIIQWPDTPMETIHFQLQGELINLVLEGGDGDDVIEIEGEYARVLVSDLSGDDQLQLANAQYASLMLIDHDGIDSIYLGDGQAFVSPGPGNDYLQTGQGNQIIDDEPEDTIDISHEGVVLLSQAIWEEG